MKIGVRNLPPTAHQRLGFIGCGRVQNFAVILLGHDQAAHLDIFDWKGMSALTTVAPFSRTLGNTDDLTFDDVIEGP